VKAHVMTTKHFIILSFLYTPQLTEYQIVELHLFIHRQYYNETNDVQRQ